jgi:hypothetical protein
VTSHIEQVEAINAERAAMPKEQRVQAEAADAPLLRIQLAYAMQRAEDAEAKTGQPARRSSCGRSSTPCTPR